MDHTPIESLFHHSPNCPCESCKKAIKPFQNGTFVRKEDIDAMNKNIQDLLQEISRIETELDQSNRQKVSMEEYIQQLLQTIHSKTQAASNELQQAQTEQVAHKPSTNQSEEEESDDEESDDEEEVVQLPTIRKKAKNHRNMTISIDTSKLFYIAVIVIIVIMVLKK